MSRPKRNAFTLLGWVVWKLLALVGLPMAKKKLDEKQSNKRLGRRHR